MSSIGLYEGPVWYKEKVSGPAERLEGDLYNIVQDLLAISTVDHAIHALDQAVEMVKHEHEERKEARDRS